jgi:hypothetical protein
MQADYPRVQKDTRMPRRWNWEVRGKNHYATLRWQQLELIVQAPLTAVEVRVKRLALAQEMVELVLADGQELPGAQRRTLRRLTAVLAGLRRQVCGQG